MDEDAPIEVTLQAEGCVRDPNGLHLKVASDFSRVCRGFASRVTVTRQDIRRSADGKSPLALLTLGASADRLLSIEVRGADAAQAWEALKPFFLLQTGES
ncbi:MAG: HPr family phosphocarrier protein [Oligosphaeraceae bacterium]